jgi:hypothetical protein
MKLGKQGFTIPELWSVIIVTGIFVSLVLFFGMSYWRYAFLLEGDLSTLITRLDAQDYLRENIGTSSGLIIQNSIPDSHTNNPDVNIASGLYWIPLHAIPTTSSVSGSGTTPLLYFKRLSSNTSEAFIFNGTQPYEDEYVMYLNSATKQILVRSLANPNAANNRIKTSCPPALSSASCPADKVIADDISSVAIKYFSRSGNPIDWTSIYDSNINTYAGPDFPSVEVVEFTLNISKKPVFQKTNATINSTIIRIALRNT